MCIKVEQYITAKPKLTVNWSKLNSQDIVNNSDSIQEPKLT